MGCSAKNVLANAPATVVTVNGIVIARDEIAREMQNHPARSPLAAWQAAARALAIRELLLQRARELELQPSAAATGTGPQETAEEALISAVIAHDIRTPEADLATCQRFYERHRDRFRSPDIFEASHILFAASSGDAAACERARVRASEVRDAIVAGTVDFAEAARTCSDCPSGRSGGSLGQITVGDTAPEFEAALMTLAPGEMASEPVPSRYGIHVIRLDRRIPGALLPFEDMAAQIADRLEAESERRALESYVDHLVATAEIRGVDLRPAGATANG